MKSKINILILAFCSLSCSKQMKNVYPGLYSNQHTSPYVTELNFLNNNTFCHYYEMECIAMPQINLGVYEEVSDSIKLIKNKDYFLNSNVIINKEDNSDYLSIEPYILVDFLTKDDRWTIATSLSISMERQNGTKYLKSKQFFFPNEEEIRIKKSDLIAARKILITDNFIEHTYEIEYSDSLNSIMTPTGFINLNCYKNTNDVTRYKVYKFKNKLKVKYTDNHTISYKLYEK